MRRRDFLTSAAAGALGMAGVLPTRSLAQGEGSGKRPNIVLIMCDDMGYSDPGCYGGEIETPNIDGLAAGGLRFSQFYNCAKCSPTRNSLLTGRYRGKVGDEDALTIAEGLGAAGYRTLMSGKWHVGSRPIKSGFDRYFGMLAGACNYFTPDDSMHLDDEPWTTDDESYYTTNTWTDYALRFLDEAGGKEEPFFLYMAYNAPHYPLHALPEDIAKYRGRYMKGWDAIRRERYQRLVELGLIEKKWALSARGQDEHRSFSPIPPWDEIEDKGAEDLDMAVYAAMVDRMDQNIGRILGKIREMGAEENTLVMFLSDNGGCPYERNRTPDIAPGPEESYRTYDSHWANVSNTPFRLYKRFNHEGGNATPLVAYWPAVIKNGGKITHETGHVIDLMATCLDVAGAEQSTEYQEREIAPVDGKSLFPIFERGTRKGHDALFWEYTGNKAVRQGRWKAVTVGGGPWELYDLVADRTEQNNLAEKMPDKARELVALWEDWARRHGVRIRARD